MNPLQALQPNPQPPKPPPLGMLPNILQNQNEMAGSTPMFNPQIAPQTNVNAAPQMSRMPSVPPQGGGNLPQPGANISQATPQINSQSQNNKGGIMGFLQKINPFKGSTESKTPGPFSKASDFGKTQGAYLTAINANTPPLPAIFAKYITAAHAAVDTGNDWLVWEPLRQYLVAEYDLLGAKLPPEFYVPIPPGPAPGTELMRSGKDIVAKGIDAGVGIGSGALIESATGGNSATNNSSSKSKERAKRITAKGGSPVQTGPYKYGTPSTGYYKTYLESILANQ